MSLLFYLPVPNDHLRNHETCVGLSKISQHLGEATVSALPTRAGKKKTKITQKYVGLKKQTKKHPRAKGCDRTPETKLRRYQPTNAHVLDPSHSYDLYNPCQSTNHKLYRSTEQTKRSVSTNNMMLEQVQLICFLGQSVYAQLHAKVQSTLHNSNKLIDYVRN